MINCRALHRGDGAPGLEASLWELNLQVLFYDTMVLNPAGKSIVHYNNGWTKISADLLFKRTTDPQIFCGILCNFIGKFYIYGLDLFESGRA